MKLPLLLASFFGLTGVLLGAFGAHALKKVLTEQQLVSWEVGVRYQLVHALALLGVALLLQHGLAVKPALWLFGAGTLLFSGSIYLLSFGVGSGTTLVFVTPLGGVLLMAGWGTLLLAAFRL